jgi:HEAT repeat protein
MRVHSFAAFVLSVFLLGGSAWVHVGSADAPDGDSPKGGKADDADERLLQAAGVPTEGAKLLDYFRQRSPFAVDPKELDELVQRLGSSNFQEREEASQKLIAAGPLATERLRRAMEDPDAEVARRAKLCLERIEGNRNVEVLTAAVRRLVKLRPAGAVQTLLSYLPFGPEETVQEETWFGLDAVAARDGRVPVEVARGLRDPIPIRRAAVGYLLSRRGEAQQRAAAKALLSDPDPLVRLRTAQGLLGAADKDALPALIGLLDQDSITLAWQAEELLHYAAGDEVVPESRVGAGTAKSRRECHQAWLAWWKQHGRQLDLSVLDRSARRPFLVLATQNPARFDKRVWLYGCWAKPHWQLELPEPVADVQLLPGGRLLLAERSAVTERSPEGKLLWHYPQQGDLVAARRLPSGEVLIVNRTEGVCQVSPQGKVVFSHRRTGPDAPLDPVLCAPFILRNGNLCYRGRDFHHGNDLLEVDPRSGREVKHFQESAGSHYNSLGTEIDTLPDGHYLLTGGPRSAVVKMDGRGRPFWEAAVRDLAHAVPLRNGNILVSCYRGGCRFRLLEVDGQGRTLLEVPTEVSLRLHPCLPLVQLGFNSPRPADLDLASLAWRIRGLGAKDPVVRRMSAEALGDMGKRGAPAIPALIDGQVDDDLTARRAALEALSAIIRPDGLALLLKALQDQRPRVRRSAVYLLWKFHDQPRVVLPVVLRALHDENASVRMEAATILRHFGTEVEAVVPALVGALKDDAQEGDDTAVSTAAAQSLRSFGAAARPAVPALKELVARGSPQARAESVYSLGIIAEHDENSVPNVLPVLERALKDKDGQVRATAACALGWIRPSARSTIPLLTQASRDADKRVREAAAEALKRLGE